MKLGHWCNDHEGRVALLRVVGAFSIIVKSLWTLVWSSNLVPGKIVENNNVSLLFRLHRPARPHVGAGGQAEVLADGGGGGVLPRQVGSTIREFAEMVQYSWFWSSFVKSFLQVSSVKLAVKSLCCCSTSPLPLAIDAAFSSFHTALQNKTTMLW